MQKIIGANEIVLNCTFPKMVFTSYSVAYNTQRVHNINVSFSLRQFTINEIQHVSFVFHRFSADSVSTCVCACVCVHVGAHAHLHIYVTRLLSLKVHDTFHVYDSLQLILCNFELTNVVPFIFTLKSSRLWQHVVWYMITSCKTTTYRMTWCHKPQTQSMNLPHHKHSNMSLSVHAHKHIHMHSFIH
jgi:hypothetical protein